MANKATAIAGVVAKKGILVSINNSLANQLNRAYFQ